MHTATNLLTCLFTQYQICTFIMLDNRDAQHAITVSVVRKLCTKKRIRSKRNQSHRNVVIFFFQNCSLVSFLVPFFFSHSKQPLTARCHAIQCNPFAPPTVTVRHMSNENVCHFSWMFFFLFFSSQPNQQAHIPRGCNWRDHLTNWSISLFHTHLSSRHQISHYLYMCRPYAFLSLHYPMCSLISIICI